jgi:predicted permease
LAVLGYGYWQRRYAGRRDAIGQAIEIGTSRYTIVGVAPEGFTGTDIRDVDVWLPVAAAEGLRFAKARDWTTDPGAQWLLVIARLKPGANLQRAEAEATAAYRNWQRTAMRRPTPQRLAEVDSERVILGSIIPGKSLWSWTLSGSGSDVRVSELLGAVAFIVLIIACANVANLLLVRAIGRRREIAVRLALGISRRRLVAQLLTEGMLLSLFGVVGALAMTLAGSQLVRGWLIGDGAWTGGAIDVRVLIFTLVVGLATGMATSLAPALQASRPDLSASLKAGEREGLVQRSRTRTALLVAQAALAIALLCGAGMFLRSLRNATSLDLGIDARHALVAQISQGVMNLSDDESRRLFAQFAERARAVPGISSSAVAVGLPFGLSWGTTVSVPGRQLPRLRQSPVQYAVTDQYFTVLGIRTLMGRAFAPTDRAGTAPVAIVNETMARVYWPDRSPIGACIRVGGDSVPCTTVVGVVTDTRRQELVEGLIPQVYRPLDQLSTSVTGSLVSFFGYTLIAHTTGDASALVEPLRREIQATSSAVPYANVQTMGDVLGRQTRLWELGAEMFAVFGTLALVLASVGLFSVVAFTVGQRMHEFGVRTALGAQPADLLRLTVARGVAPAVFGILLGIALTLVGGRFFESLLFRESTHDPVTLGTASGIMFVCAVLASVVPAWRASQVDPTVALRAD